MPKEPRSSQNQFHHPLRRAHPSWQWNIGRRVSYIFSLLYKKYDHFADQALEDRHFLFVNVAYFLRSWLRVFWIRHWCYSWERFYFHAQMILTWMALAVLVRVVRCAISGKLPSPCASRGGKRRLPLFFKGQQSSGNSHSVQHRADPPGHTGTLELLSLLQNWCHFFGSQFPELACFSYFHFHIRTTSHGHTTLWAATFQRINCIYLNHRP